MLVDLKCLIDVAKRHGKGAYESFIFKHNAAHLLWPEQPTQFDREFPDFFNDLGSYGVVDSPKQFLEKFSDFLEKDKRPLVVMFDHVEKKPENIGLGGGWRWYKWGEYLGDGQPTSEYLDDEEGFLDGIYCFHIYNVEELETIEIVDESSEENNTNLGLKNLKGILEGIIRQCDDNDNPIWQIANIRGMAVQGLKQIEKR